jgi:hypothetical protein
VRRTVASSIHELAAILGEDLASRDLVPVFIGFLKDLDEVRIGALKHLSEFLKVLFPPPYWLPVCRVVNPNVSHFILPVLFHGLF